MTKILGKDELLSGSILRRELVTILDADISVWMRELSAEHVVIFKNQIDALKSNGLKETTLEQDIELMAQVVSFSACDENGNLLLTQEEAKGLARNGVSLLMELGNKALELSKLKMGQMGFISEVADNLPKDPTTYSSENSRKNSRKRAGKS